MEQLLLGHYLLNGWIAGRCGYSTLVLSPNQVEVAFHAPGSAPTKKRRQDELLKNQITVDAPVLDNVHVLSIISSIAYSQNTMI